MDNMIYAGWSVRILANLRRRNQKLRFYTAARSSHDDGIDLTMKQYGYATTARAARGLMIDVIIEFDSAAAHRGSLDTAG